MLRANPLQGPLEGVGPESRDFMGPEIATSEASAKFSTNTHETDYSASISRQDAHSRNALLKPDEAEHYATLAWSR